MRRRRPSGYGSSVGARIASYAVVVGIAIAGAVVFVAVLYGGGLPPADVVFVATLFALLGVSLRAAWIAWRSARRAAQQAKAATARTADDAVRAALDEERARVSADIEAVVRRSLLAMRAWASAIQHAVRAGKPGPDTPAQTVSVGGRTIGVPDALQQIQDEGRAATTELRRLLELLRSSDGDTVPPESVPRPQDTPRGLGMRDILPAVAATGVCLVETRFAVDAGHLSFAAAGLTVATAAASIGWRRDPGTVLGVQAFVIAVGVMSGALVEFGLWSLPALGLPMWAAFAAPRRGPLALAGPATLSAAALTSQWISSDENVPILVAVLGIAAATGIVRRSLDRRRRGSSARAAEHEARLHRIAAEAVRRDRVSTARELHDAISGTIGVIVMQAGAAELRWRADRTAALRSLDVVVASAEQALRELDDLVPRLADSSIDGSSRRGPQDIGSLVERMNRAGVDVTAALPDPLPALPPDVAATVYRIAQEGVANAARHAPGSRISVRLLAHDRTISVSVLDDGPGATGRPVRGYGLTGLSERVAELGGEFVAGPRPGRGFRIEARLPVTRRQETSA